MPAEYSIEKRDSIRFSLAIPVQCLDCGTRSVCLAETHDISNTGLSLLADRDLPIHSSLNIRLKIPDNEEEIYAKGRVVWSKMIYSNQWRVGLSIAQATLKPIPIILRVINAKSRYYHNKYQRTPGCQPKIFTSGRFL
ncbi:MAG: PilZ domain-containing protein [Candidatus Omnitrophota bacterium]|nr:PilZ domain-containing protein [Candidatus Omnitrophota bacterium]MBU1928316.1 PilZ domain-containing protein [Candidatus Omnitrophota bacterium]MBU2035528.1 PilZ domain-containing protein [Candidatus Omnitrophota bacterium]MBU2222049.1 PilZ domain-containing protein [Candidatus Omnitrophota bacterium]